MRNKWFRRAAILIFTVFLAGTLAIDFLGIQQKRAWVGVNYWGQPIDAYGQFVVMLLVALFGAIWLIRHRDWWL